MRPARRLGARRRHPSREDEDRHRLGDAPRSRCRPGRGRPDRHRRRRRALRRRQRRLHRQAGHPPGGDVRRSRRHLVRGAGVLRRPDRPAADSASATPIDVAAGEYGYDLVYFERMCAAGAVDVLQADVSRCAGITEWLRVASGRRRPRPRDLRPLRPVAARRTRPARCPTSVTWSTSTTTPASTASCSTVSWTRPG